MTKAEIVDKVSAEAGITKSQADNALGAFTKAVDGLVVGDKLVLRGFGTFRRVTRKEKVGRNPKTGKQLTVPEKDVLRFKESN